MGFATDHSHATAPLLKQEPSADMFIRIPGRANVVRTGIVLAALGAPAAHGEAPPRTIEAECLLAVDGHEYVHGRCPVYLEPGGTFTLNTGQPNRPLTWFAFVSVEPDGTGTAYWNEEKGVDKADSRLGAVTRHGACWSNARARICARR
jgi:hypothetical protein